MNDIRNLPRIFAVHDQILPHPVKSPQLDILVIVFREFFLYQVNIPLRHLAAVGFDRKIFGHPVIVDIPEIRDLVAHPRNRDNDFALARRRFPYRFDCTVQGVNVASGRKIAVQPFLPERFIAFHIAGLLSLMIKGQEKKSIEPPAYRAPGFPGFRNITAQIIHRAGLPFIDQDTVVETNLLRLRVSRPPDGNSGPEQDAQYAYSD